MQKILFSVNLLDCDDDYYTDSFDFAAVFSSDLFNDVPLVFSYDIEWLTACDFDIQADCGDQDGEVSYEPLDFPNVLFTLIEIDESFQLFSDQVDNLSAGEYTVQVIYSGECSNSFTLTVPDGSFTIDVTTIEPLLNCVNSVSDEDASGVIPATVEGLFVGGSGEFDIEISLPGAIYSVDEFDFVISGIESAGTFGLTATDLDTGCEAVDVVIVTDDDLVFETTDVDVIPIVTNGYDDYYPDYGVITVETVLDASYNLEYDWSPGPGTNGNDGTYSNIEDPNIYTMIATVENTTCQLEIEVDMTDLICFVFADFNGDGFVNSPDLTAFLAVWDTTCPSESTPSNPCLGDLNFDGVINQSDLTIFLALWGLNTSELVYDVCGF